MRGSVGSAATLGLVLRLGLGLGALACACTSASGDVTGGELRPGLDAAPPPGLVVAEFPDASPTSWRGLYRDFFSPNATSGCGRFSTCHATTGKEGALVSAFVCADVDGCWASLRTSKHPGTKKSLVEDTAIAAPSTAELFTWLRTAENPASMPKEPSDFVFSADAIERMKTWIRNGAKND